MCLAVPSRVVRLEGETATVECFGVERVVSLMLMEEPVALGDYVLVQMGTYAVEKIEAEAALETLGYFAQVVEAS